MIAVPLAHADDPAQFGGKAAQLSAALRAGLPVPRGTALSWPFVDEVVRGDRSALEGVRRAFVEAGGFVAVRSSAVGEDGAEASFAGQHETHLGVVRADDAIEAVRAVHASAHAPSALAYRARLGITAPPRIAVVLQSLVRADVAGILFTKDPMSGRDERLIEASWGLGEVVVSGTVTPDRYRIARSGAILERTSGEKDVAVFADERGRREETIEGARVHALCLDDAKLAALHALATACEEHFLGDQDLEWAFERDQLFLLQRRPITRIAR